MSRPARLAAAAALAALAACSTKTSSTPNAHFALPTSVAVFRGVTVAHGADPSSAVHPYWPHLAVANTGTDDLTIVDAVTDTVLPAPVPLHGLSYPVEFRPTLVVSADLGDRKPDLLLAVSGGDSRLKLVRTWQPDGQVVDSVALGATVVAVVALPPDPASPGTARVVAALAGGRLAVTTFARSTSGDGTGIRVAGPPAVSGDLGFQAVDLAALPGDRTRVWAATPDAIPLGGVRGVAVVDVTGVPLLAAALDATAPTRLVSAALLAEAPFDPPVLDTTAFQGQPVTPRIYAVLDESPVDGVIRCGLFAPIPCGVVALDPTVTGAPALLPDPTPAPFTAPWRAPLPIPFPLGLASSGPPAFPPDAADPQYAVTWARIQTALGSRAATALGAASSNDGTVWFVDLSRWELPSSSQIHANVRAAVLPVSPASNAQWLTLLDPVSGTTVSHLDATGLTSAATVTAGFTPLDRWVVTYQGILPWLGSRRSEVGFDGSLWLAMQATDPAQASTTEVVNLFDPVLGVHAGDVVVFDPNVVGTCSSFEATVTALEPPDPTRFPGGALRIDDRVVASDPASTAAWGTCMALLRSAAAGQAPANPVRALRATVRAGGYEVVRGSGTPSIHVGRASLGAPFTVAWQDEAPLAAACRLPPARPWPPSAADAAACVPGSACRSACEDLLKARLARRVGYLSEAGANGSALTGGPALAFTLALETSIAPPRELQLLVTTLDGRSPLRSAPSAVLVGNGALVPFDRSPWNAAAGLRFLAPYSTNVVLDATPTLFGSVGTIQ